MISSATILWKLGKIPRKKRPETTTYFETLLIVLLEYVLNCLFLSKSLRFEDRAEDPKFKQEKVERSLSKSQLLHHLNSKHSSCEQ